MSIKNLKLYNHHREQVGEAIFRKRNSTFVIQYNNSIHYKNTVVELEEFENYKCRLDLKDENELGQLELF